jgi:hypothetical protein
VKVTDGIHYLNQDKGGHVHAFLLDEGNGISLIDALYHVRVSKPSGRA